MENPNSLPLCELRNEINESFFLVLIATNERWKKFRVEWEKKEIIFIRIKKLNKRNS